MVQSLERLASAAEVVEGVRVGDLEPGDCLFVRTRNSLYTLRLNSDGTFDAAGGWFSRQHDAKPSPDGTDLPADASAAGLPADASAEKSGRRRRVIGCTWGGTALMTRMIAAPGMFIEFDNRVRTTRIKEVRHLRPTPASTIH
jgi:hypothetical protein